MDAGEWNAVGLEAKALQRGIIAALKAVRIKAAYAGMLKHAEVGGHALLRACKGYIERLRS